MKTPRPFPDPLGSVPFTTREARDAGIPPHRLRNANVQHPFRGVNRVSDNELTLVERRAAYQRRMFDDSRFCGPTAAVIVGVPLPRTLAKASMLHVAVPQSRIAPRARGIRGHSIAMLDGDSMLWQGLRVSSPEQIFCELAPLITELALIAAGDYLVHHRQPLTSKEEIAKAVARFPGKRGYLSMCAALEMLDERSESPKESQLRVILKRARIETVANFPIRTSGGFDYRVDLAMPERRIVIEYQSDEFHSDPLARRRDMTRRARLEADGWFVIELNADDLASPNELVERLRRVIARRPLVV